MRIRKISLTTQISVALGFGLAAAALFGGKSPNRSQAPDGVDPVNSGSLWLRWLLVSAQCLWDSAARSLLFPRRHSGVIKLRSANLRFISPSPSAPLAPFPRYVTMMMLPHLHFGETILPVVADDLRCFLRCRRGYLRYYCN